MEAEASVAKTSEESLTDYRFFSIFRVLFGLCITAYAATKYVSGFITWGLIRPEFHFTYIGFSWVRPLPEPATSACFLLLAAAGLVMASGYLYRLSTILVLLLYSYTVLVDKVNYNNHYYLVIVLSLYFCLVPAHGKEGPKWGLDLFRYQIALVYFFAGLAKWNRDWLLAEPLAMWLEARAQVFHMPMLAEPYVAAAMCIAGLLLDLVAGPALLFAKTRYPAMIALAGFHLSNEYLFDIGVFPALMLATMLLFLGPTSTPRATSWRQGVAKGALLILILQLLLPLRHYFIPGLCAWTEDGHRYAWRMKLRNKRARLTEVRVGTEVIDHYSILIPPQLHKIGGRPDLLHDFAQYLSQKHDGAPVYLTSMASLNGRPWQTYSDGLVDLSQAKLPRLGETEWVQPLRVPYLNKKPKWTLRASVAYVYIFVAFGLLGGWLNYRDLPRKTIWLWFGSGLLVLLALYSFFLRLNATLLALTWLILLARGLLTEKVTQGHFLGRIETSLCCVTLALTSSIVFLYGF